MIENMVRNLRALLRAESIIADLHFRELLSRLMLKALAGLIAVFGLLMLNVSAFFEIEQYFGRVWSAASVALGGDYCGHRRTVPKIQRTRSCPGGSPRGQSFESDSRLIQNQFSMLTDEVRTIKTSMTNFIRHPLDEALSQVIAPLAAIIIRNLGKKRSSGKSARSSSSKG